MRVVLCIDDNTHYLPLLKVAVRSLRAVQGGDTPCLCVYAGDNREILDTLASEKIPLAAYAPRLNKTNLPQSVWRCIGCFLKLELSLVPELADEEQVLYCDADVMFRKPLDELFNSPPPRYMAMARENTAPFYHKYQTLSYTYNNNLYKVPMPFPIWTFSSGVVKFNLAKLRQHNLIDHFLAFSQENAERIENLDQSLLNYYFGKKISRLEGRWNCPPYMKESLDEGHIIHFHGPKPWQTSGDLADLRINNFEALRKVWHSYLNEDEIKLVSRWNMTDACRIY